MHDGRCIPTDAYNACRFHLRANFPQLAPCEVVDDQGQCERMGAARIPNPHREAEWDPIDTVMCAEHLKGA